MKHKTDLCAMHDRMSVTILKRTLVINIWFLFSLCRRFTLIVASFHFKKKMNNHNDEM